MIKNFVKYVKPSSKNKVLFFLEYLYLVIINLFKLIIKKFCSVVPINYYENLMPYSLNFNYFKKLKNVTIYEKREMLWDFAIEKIGIDKPILFLEFGTFEGYSIKYFSNKNKNKNSVFVGCDTFTGLPEKWNRMPKGMWDVDGNMPVIDDKRVKFIKGKFQNTFEEIKKNIDLEKELLFHFDADLYSATLFLLTKLDFCKSFYAIFDEFTGHESRALYNYCQSFDAEVEFYANTKGYANTPHRVFCKIYTSNEKK